MKGGEEGITLAGTVIIMVIFLMVFFMIILKLPKADLQVALLNTERLATNINEVCKLSNTKTVKDFSLLQPRAQNFGGFFNFIPKFAIYGGGDPNYVLYYESFPIGEGIGWEVYQDFGSRVFAPIQDRGPRPELEHFRDKANKYVGTVDDKIVKGEITNAKIIVPNVVLNKYTNVLFIEDPKPIFNTEKNEKTSKIGNLGEWKGDRFDFSSVISLSQLEKSSIKYRPCGENSLCLKTRENVFRFPLDCDDIDSIHLEYDARNRALVYGAGVAIVGGAVALPYAAPLVSTAASTTLTGVFKFGGKILAVTKSLFGRIATTTLVIGTTSYAAEEGLTFFFGSFLSLKNSDFYLASPCSIDEMTIEKVPCKDLGCSRWIKYPIYEINDNSNVDSYGSRYQCIENIGESGSSTVTAPPGDCIKIKITDRPKDFCWTPDPSRDFSILDTDTIGIAKLLGFLPVQDSTRYANENQVEAVILKPTKESRASLDSMLGFIGDFVEIKKFSAWAWPG